MISASAARSTSLTRSFLVLCWTVNCSMFSAARLIISPARRAALTAKPNIGFIVISQVCLKNESVILN